MTTTDKNNNVELFESYLLQKQYADATIKRDIQNLNYYQMWFKKMINNQQDILFSTSRDVLFYVKYQQQNQISVGAINNRINTLKKYFNFLIESSMIAKHPIRNLVIKGQAKTVTKNIQNEQELKELYQNFIAYQKLKLQERPKMYYREESHRIESSKRYSLIASLLIFQGLKTTELDNLTISDIDIENATVYIPSSKKSNSRILPLNTLQIIEFYKYLQELPVEQEKLFSVKVERIVQNILAELKGVNTKINNLRQIRDSVIIDWIKKHGKRKAQYMAGHKYVSSTEKFEVQDTSKLLELVNKVHLFG